MSGSENKRKHGKCDVTIIAKGDGTRITAHRLVLAKSSEYFRTMFSSSFKEGTADEIEMTDISGSELNAIIEYAYTGKISINKNNVQNLLPKAAEMLYEDIVKKCGDFLANKVTSTNCIKMASLAKLYNCKYLLQMAKYYQKEHFTKLITKEEIFELNAEEFYEFLCEHEMEDVDLEKRVFKCIMQWVEHDRQSREKFLPKLLGAIHLRFIENKFLLEDISNAVGDNEECVQIIKEVFEKEAALKGKNLLIGFKDNFQIYDLENKSIKESYNLKHLECIDAAFVNNKLFIACESDAGCNVKSYNLTTRILTHLPPTLNELEFCHITEYKGNLYAIGFEIVSNCIIEKFDFLRNRWSIVAKFPAEDEYEEENDYLCSFASIKEKLFFVFKSEEELNKMYCFNLETNRWSLCAPLLEKRVTFSMVAFKNDLFVFEQDTYDRNIEKYNSVANEWSKVAQLTNVYEQMTACVVDDKIIVIGLFEKSDIVDFDNVLFLMEEFDPETNKCEVIGKLSIKCNSEDLSDIGPFFANF